MSSVINVRLNEKMTLRFVELYRDQRLLWDKEHESYNKRADRLRAYRRIADGMGVEGMGVPEVASKIKNIRSTYLQELKKIKDSTQRHLVQSEDEDALSPYVPKLLWFPILDSMIGGVAVKRLYSSPSTADMLVSFFLKKKKTIRNVSPVPSYGTSRKNEPARAGMFVVRTAFIARRLRRGEIYDVNNTGMSTAGTISRIGPYFAHVRHFLRVPYLIGQ